MSHPSPSVRPSDRLDAAVRTAGVGVWLNPLPLGDLIWNDNTKAHFHLPADARPTAEMFFGRLHADDRERVRQAVTRTVEDRRPFDEVYRTVGPQGQEKWIHAVGRAVFSDEGVATQFDGITLDVTSAITAQQQLREFADSAPAMLWSTEADGLCSFLSRGWSRFTGMPEAAGLGFGWLETVHPEDRLAAHEAFVRATEQRCAFSLEHRVRRPDGSYSWVVDAGQPRLGANGEFLGFAGSVTDIHERREVEQALRRSNQRYSRLLASIDQGFCVVQILLDAQGSPVDYRFLECNAVFERQTGLVGPVGRTARELVPGLEDFWFQTYGKVGITREPVRFTHGSSAMGRWFDVYASPIGEAQDLQVAILFQDVSQRIEQERRLRESEERYRGFLASTSEGIWRMEFQPPVDLQLAPAEQIIALFAHGRLAECNSVFARMHGLAEPGAAVGRGLGWMFDATDPRVRLYLEKLIQASYRSGEGEWLVVAPNGQPQWFASSFLGVVENGSLVRAWGTRRDITARKRAEAALLEADQRKDEFLATLAHELRNPLAPIRSAAELIRRGSQDEARLQRHAAVIGRQVTHLARMIDDLMDVSRITRGKLELSLAPLVVQDVLRAACESTHAALQADAHTLTLDLPEIPVCIVGDEVRLVQIFSNLLTNAARYSARGRPIELSLLGLAGQAVVRVRDQGIGIAPDQLKRVFELFYQGGVASERGHGGLGIGLSLVQQLTALHHGTVQASSAGLGHGSEFVVRLPLAGTGFASADASTGDGSRRSGRLLIVDDQRDGADTLADVMGSMGYEVSTAYDGVEGLAQAEAMRPDIAVLDLGMPRMDGYGLCRALREHDWGRRMTVLALSGWGQTADRERSRAAGFDVHLVKPIDPQALVQAIERARAGDRS
jgi:PAS domain S-box-containing protein